MTLLIPAKRLKWLPKEVHLAHQYCFFLHDEIVRMLAEYEAVEAHIVRFQFSNKGQAKKFKKLAKTHDAVTALRELGLHSEARRVVLNTITVAMVSDCAHHIYESLRCFEKRKIVPAFNLLRKPLLDNMMYFSWMAADEDGFYSAFTAGDPAKINQKTIGNFRKTILEKNIKTSELAGLIEAEDLISIVFDATNPNGLYGLFQHAVHLVTVDRIEIKTSPENFNFIFKSPSDDDVYEILYAVLPMVLLYMTHVVMTLYERIKAMDVGAKKALIFRTVNGYRLLGYARGAALLADAIGSVLSHQFKCGDCDAPLKVTEHNVARLLLTDSFRCTQCRRIQPFPLSWVF